MCRRFVLSEDFWPQLDRLIYFVFFPALLFARGGGDTIAAQMMLGTLRAALTLPLDGVVGDRAGRNRGSGMRLPANPFSPTCT